MFCPENLALWRVRVLPLCPSPPRGAARHTVPSSTSSQFVFHVSLFLPHMVCGLYHLDRLVAPQWAVAPAGGLVPHPAPRKGSSAPCAWEQLLDDRRPPFPSDVLAGLCRLRSPLGCFLHLQDVSESLWIPHQSRHISSDMQDNYTSNVPVFIISKIKQEGV